MPFTLSHTVLAPALARLSGQHLPVAALAIGCMSPDLYRLFTEENYNFSHQWQSLYSLNLAMGLFFCLLWYLLYRPVLYRFFNLEHRMQIHTWLAALKFVLMLCIAIMLGAATHLLWDGLTHSDFRTFAFEAFLNQELSLFQQHYPMHRVLQIGSSIAALPILLWLCWRYFVAHRSPVPQTRRVQIYAITLGLVSFFSACFVYVYQAKQLDPVLRQTDLYSYLGRSINIFSTAFLICLSLGCLLFLILDRLRYFSRDPA